MTALVYSSPHIQLSKRRCNRPRTASLPGDGSFRGQRRWIPSDGKFQKLKWLVGVGHIHARRIVEGRLRSSRGPLPPEGLHATVPLMLMQTFTTALARLGSDNRSVATRVETWEADGGVSPLSRRRS